MAPVLLCDLDGTLVDTVADLTVALNRLLAERGLPPLGEGTVRRLVGRGAARLVARGLDAAGGPVSDDELAPLVHRFLEIYEAAPAATSRPYPGVVECLERLAAEGWRLGVVTNKPQAPSEAILQALGLGRFFEAVAGGDRFPVRKPDGGHIRATLELMGAAPARAALVGDSETDLAAGRDAGVPVVLVDYGYSEVPAARLGPERVISGFGELPQVLAELGLARRQQA